MNHASDRTSANWSARLDRLEWLILMAMLAVVILVYPLRLQDSWLGPLNDWWDSPDKSFWARLTANEIRAFVSFYFSPLILKGVLASVLMLTFIAVRLMRPLLGLPGRKPAAGNWAWLSVPLFFGWSALSALWSPTPVISREVAFWAILHGVFLYMLLQRGITLSEMRRLATTFIILGAIIIFVAFFQFTAAMQSGLPFSGWIFKFMYQFPDKRNLFGSLIGHNTAAASFAMLTAFVALGVVLGARTEARRSFGAVYLVLALFGIIIFQSRSIWVLAPALGLVAAFTLMRRAGKRSVSPMVLAAIGLCVLVFLSQAIPNPLQRQGNMLSRRLNDLSAESLRGESRLRLNVIGAPMVLRHPFIGYGLFAYQYVYPPVQGHYFNLHPDSRLNQMQFRSNMAHNEYLQTAIDEGLIGLFLLLLVMFEAGRRGWRLRDRDLSDSDAILHRTFGWACLGLALHALFDFPFHLPQLAVPGMLCMAAWASLRANPGPEAAPAPGSAPASGLRLIPTLRLLAVGALIAAVPVLCRPLFLKLESDIQSNTGNGYYLGSQTPGFPLAARMKMLDTSIQYGQTAIGLHPDNYLPLMQLGDAYLMRGGYAARFSRMPGATAQIKESALSDLYNARKCYDAASKGLQFHYLTYQRAQVARQLAILLNDRSEMAAYRNDLERTVQLCPAFTDADYELAELLDSQNDPESAKRAFELRRTFLRLNPLDFDQKYVVPAYDLMRQRRFAEAARAWEKILAQNPKKLEWLVSTVSAEIYAGNRKRASQIADDLRVNGGDAYFGSGMWYYDGLLKKNWANLVKELERFVGSPKTNDVVVECHVVEQEAVARAGILRDIDRFPKPASMKKNEWEQAIADRRPGILLFLIDDPAAALQAMRQRLADGAKVPLGVWADAWYIGRASGDKALVQQALDGMKAINASNKTYLDLAAQTK